MKMTAAQAMEIRNSATFIECDSTALSECIDEALMKQIEAEPFSAYKTMDGTHIIWYCPACQERHITKKKKPYCDECGQKVCWKGVKL